MKRQTRGLDLSIRGDELERHRIELEQNLQNTDISLRLSAASEDEYEEPSSVEYPRHNSGPGAFLSFEIPSRDHYDGDTQSQIHPWSFRTNDDEEGINPYGAGGSLSTAAHHASALTLSAGLGGYRAGRQDISLSGAEYDPDRPLKDMIGGMDPKLSMFDIEPSRSRYMGDPLVVDSTAELDRMLQTGHVSPIASPLLPSSSSSDSESGHDNPKPSTTRPKLADSLRRVSFSPQRPRSNPGSPRISSRQPRILNQNEPLPPAEKKRTDIFPSYGTPRPQVRLQPPTPANTSYVAQSQSQSQFTKLARGITREIQYAQRGEASKHAERNPFDTSAGHMSAKPQQQTPARPSAMKQRNATPGPNLKAKVHLPDVTGLTSAVESPMKLGSEYYVYPGSPRETEARLVAMLNTVQSKLQHFEEENGISRRRVRELELELEVCKRDVARERTRVLEREEVIVQQQRDVSFNAALRRKDKGKGRAKDMTTDQEGLYQKYKEAVEGQKALEALITTLRTHLTRLTAELSSHRTLLMELRELRNADAQTIKVKSAEVERLSREVERLGGEVEVLRGVVEEGLRERRGAREAEEVLDESNVAMSLNKEVEEQEQERQEEDAQVNEEEAEEEPEPFGPTSIAGPSRNLANRTMTIRTDQADFVSSNPDPRSLMPLAQAQGTGTSVQFINSAEFERISAEVEERRFLEHHTIPPEPARPQSRRATVEDASDDEDEKRKVSHKSGPPPRSQTTANQEQNQNRHLQTPKARHQRVHQRKDETPFPQIRGGHLERLFFSAPEHNAHRCNVCCRRRRANADEDEEMSWLPPRFKGMRKEEEEESTEEEKVEDTEDEDEGFADEEERRPQVAGGQQKEEQKYWRLRGLREGLPPQTVVARVIRELEDDFTHYKGVYVELAEQYKDMDPVSDVARRNLLAKHLREVIDVLEQKGDQIAALYDLLTFKDKPVEESVVPPRRLTETSAKMPAGRMVSTTTVPSTLNGRSAGIRRQHRAFA
ncbi:hypothetical protein C0989_000154 [Termitomyces sp. Mn162]|nr:hypothetical protein C0989_000154 [Termitomyces sp. Mn162]